MDVNCTSSTSQSYTVMEKNMVMWMGCLVKHELPHCQEPVISTAFRLLSLAGGVVGTVLHKQDEGGDTRD